MSDDLTMSQVDDICQAAGADNVVVDVDADRATGECRARARAYFPDGHVVEGLSEPYRPFHVVGARASRVEQAMRRLVDQLRPPEIAVRVNRRGVETYGDPVVGLYGEKVSIRAHSGRSGQNIWVHIEDPLDPDEPALSLSARVSVDQATAIRDRLDLAISRAREVAADGVVSL